MTIPMSVAFIGAALIRAKAPNRGRRLFQYGYPKVRHLLEEIRYVSFYFGEIFQFISYVC